MEDKKNKRVTKLLWSIIVVYVIMLLLVVIFKYGLEFVGRSVNLIPFYFLSEFSNLNKNIVFTNIVGNVVIFIPFGIIVGLFIKNFTVLKVTLNGFLLSLFFESIQYIFGIGASDVDDLILNTFGAFIGALVYSIIVKIAKETNKIRYLSVIGLIISGLICVLTIII